VVLFICGNLKLKITLISRNSKIILFTAQEVVKQNCSLNFHIYFGLLPRWRFDKHKVINHDPSLLCR
jgi:hypothetical protein